MAITAETAPSDSSFAVWTYSARHSPRSLNADAARRLNTSSTAAASRDTGALKVRIVSASSPATSAPKRLATISRGNCDAAVLTESAGSESAGNRLWRYMNATQADQAGGEPGAVALTATTRASSAPAPCASARPVPLGQRRLAASWRPVTAAACTMRRRLSRP